jgi:hypothetical protein
MHKIYERREPDLVTMAERLGTTNWLNHERLSSRSSTLRGNRVDTIVRLTARGEAGIRRARKR